jgi:hypothetical protein
MDGNDDTSTADDPDGSNTNPAEHTLLKPLVERRDTHPTYDAILADGAIAEGPFVQTVIRGWTVNSSTPLSDDDVAVIERAIDRTALKPQACFANALRAERNVENLGYVEGVAFFEDHPVVPVEHAWNAIDGTLVELTYEPGFDVYCGVAIDDETTLNCHHEFGRTNKDYRIVHSRHYLAEQGYDRFAHLTDDSPDTGS